MTMQNLVPIPDTHRTVWPGTTPAAEVADGDVWLTAWLRPQSAGELDVERARALGATLPSGRAYASRADLRRKRRPTRKTSTPYSAIARSSAFKS